MPMEEKSRGALIALVLGLAGFMALGLVSIHAPFGRDQGVSAFVALVMARGGVLYRDVYHFNLPGVFFVYRLAAALPWPLVESVNLTHLAFLALTGLVLYRAAREVLSPWPATLAALLYAAFAVIVYTDYWDVAQKESLASLPLALALLFLLRLGGAKEESRGLRSIIWSGFGLGLGSGLSTQFKPTLGIVLFSVLVPLWQVRREKGRPFRLGLATTAGFVVSFLPLLCYLLIKGDLAAMVESVVRFGGFYGAQAYAGVFAASRESAFELLRWLFEWRFLAALSVIALIQSLRSSRGVQLTALFAALLLFQVVLQMKFFTYHWVPLLLPGSLLAAGGISNLLTADSLELGGRMPPSAPSLPNHRFALILLLAALLIGNLAPSAKRYRRELYYDLGALPKNNFLAAYGKWGGGDMCPLASQAVADYVKEHSRPADPLLVFGLEPGLYVLADRMPPTRFAYDQPLVTDPRGNSAFASYRETMRSQFMRDLQKKPPLYIVVIENDATGIEPEDSYTQMKAFPALRDLIEKNYVLETKIEDYFIYRRISGQGEIE